MILGDLVESIRSLSGKTTSNDQNDRIVYDINRVYRSLAKKATWPGLIEYGEEFTTEDGVDTYALPYPLEQILPGSLHYDVDTTNWPSRQLKILDNTATIGVWESTTPGVNYWPLGAMMMGGSGSAKAATVSTTSTTTYGDNSQAVDTPDNGTEVGDWIVFGQIDASSIEAPLAHASPGDYGYKVTTVGVSSFTFADYYRGPTLPIGVSVITNPGNTPRLKLIPDYTEYGKTVRFNWQRRPRRLYAPYDSMEVGALADAVIFTVLAENPQYHRPDSSDQRNFMGLAREHLRDAKRGFAATLQMT